MAIRSWWSRGKNYTATAVSAPTSAENTSLTGFGDPSLGRTDRFGDPVKPLASDYFTGEIDTTRYDAFGNVVVWDPNSRDNSFQFNTTCWQQAHCASGYECVNGRCVRVFTQGRGGGSISSPGDCGNDNASCNQGSADACRVKAGCGDGAEEECCDGKVKRYGRFGNEIKTGCFDYTTKKKCNSLCDAYFKSFGESFGTSCEGKDCGENECIECDSFTKECSPPVTIGDPPCWCFQAYGLSCGPCRVCNDERGGFGIPGPNNGECSIYNGNDPNCKVCITKPCRCGCELEAVEIEGCGYSQPAARGEATRNCKKYCEEKVVSYEDCCLIECNCDLECPSGTCSNGLCVALPPAP